MILTTEQEKELFCLFTNQAFDLNVIHKLIHQLMQRQAYREAVKKKSQEPKA
jgi:hypothetical protein